MIIAIVVVIDSVDVIVDHRISLSMQRMLSVRSIPLVLVVVYIHIHIHVVIVIVTIVVAVVERVARCGHKRLHA